MAMTQWQLDRREKARSEYGRALARVEPTRGEMVSDTVWLTREAGALPGEPPAERVM